MTTGVGTNVASVLERQWRLNAWLRKYVMGCAEGPCDICSAPEPDFILEITGDADGHLQNTEKAFDLSCVPESVEHPGERVITIDVKTRDCELTGCDGLTITENGTIFLTLCDCEEQGTNVKVYLTNNNSPVTEDEMGNPVPECYVLSPGQVKFLLIVGGRPTRIAN